MKAHMAPDGEPPIGVGPDGTTEPVFYVPGKDGMPDRLESACSHPEATKWLGSTYSVRKLVDTA